MPDEMRHESADLADYEVLDASDTLAGAPGDDPLDRGLVAPQRWSAAMRFGSTAAEQQAGESLDQLLAAEEPDVAAGAYHGRPGEDWDENATDEDVGRLALGDGPDPRTGRLAAGEPGAYFLGEHDLVARDAGIDGGGASAEEAAIHIVPDDDTARRSDLPDVPD